MNQKSPACHQQLWRLLLCSLQIKLEARIRSKKSPLHSEENQLNERLVARKNQAKHNPS